MHKCILASNNPGKVNEFNQLLQPLNWQVIPQSDYQLDSVAETGVTFVENALLKARHATKYSGLPALADDSGLSVAALNGAPGIYSARFAGEPSNDQQNNQKLLAQLANVAYPQRQATFHCVLVYLRHATDPTPLICHGQWQGFIHQQPLGDGGFGYDPLFYLPQWQKTVAQLTAAEKNRYSHRAQALQQLISQLRHEITTA